MFACVNQSPPILIFPNLTSVKIILADFITINRKNLMKIISDYKQCLSGSDCIFNRVSDSFGKKKGLKLW